MRRAVGDQMPPLANKYLELQHAEDAVDPGCGDHNHTHHRNPSSKGAASVGRDQVLAETSSAIMNKVALLTSSTHEPGVNIRQHSDLTALFGPTLDLAVRFQRLAAVASSFLFVYGHLLATSTLTSAVIATRLFAAYSAQASKTSLLAVRKFARTVWNSKKIQRMRKKVFFEFATTILGPGGNMFIIMVFWPGWLMILGLLFATRSLAG